MSVSSANDALNDILAATETTRQAQDRDRPQEGTEGAAGDPDARSLETRFSNLLKGRLTANIVFTRLDQQLDLPQRVVSDRQTAPIIDRRDDTVGRDDVDAFDPTDSLEDPIAAPIAQNNADRPTTDPTRQDPAQRPTDTPARNDANAGAGANQSNRDGNAQAQNGNSQSARQTGATEAGQAANRTLAADGLTAEDVAPELAALAAKSAKSGGAKLNATVTTQAAQVTAQPQNALAGKAAIDADAAAQRVANQRADGAAVADGELLAEAEEGANTIFNRLQAQTAAAARTGAAAANGAEAGGDKVQNGQPTAQSVQQANAQATQALHRIAGASTAASAQAGAPSAGAVADAATGGTAAIGENNSVQQRSAPSPTQAAARPTPLPHQAVADQVAVNVQRGVAQGQDKITVQLRPQELGRVEIKLEVSHDGKLTAVVAAEKPETLDMLRQDSRSLIQSLGEAGLQADDSSLSFQLQDQQAGGSDSETLAHGGQTGEDTGGDEPLIDTGFHFDDAGGFGSDGRLDVRI